MTHETTKVLYNLITINKYRIINAILKSISFLLFFMLTTRIVYSQKFNKHNHKIMDTISTIQTNKEVVGRLYEEFFNKRRLESIHEWISEEYEGFQGKKGVAGFLEPISALIQAFPDVQWKLEELMGEGNKVSLRWKIQGTHSAKFQGISATGKKVSVTGMGFYELKDGKIISSKIMTDRLSFLQALEVVPEDISTLSLRKEDKDQVVFIDNFVVPAKAKDEFYERMNFNRNFIQNLPGFIEDEALEYIDESGNYHCITIAKWENNLALSKAKESVQAEYKKQGFNPSEMLERLGISMDRKIYKATNEEIKN